MAARLPISSRAAGVLGGLAGAVVTGGVGFALASWLLLRPLTDADKLLVLFSFGMAVVLAWGGVLLSVILFAISVHAVFDALGNARGNSARRLAIVSVLLLSVILAAAISDGEAEPALFALLILGPVAGLNVAAPVLYGRASRQTNKKTE